MSNESQSGWGIKMKKCMMPGQGEWSRRESSISLNAADN